jgi:aquaporin Z
MSTSTIKTYAETKAQKASEAGDPPAAPQGKEGVASLIMELIGTFALCYVGGLAVNAGSIQDGLGNLTVVALAHGTVLALMVFIGGDISGGQYNPAVTLPLIVFGKLHATKGVMNIVGQLVGSILAGLVLNLMRPHYVETNGYPFMSTDNIEKPTIRAFCFEMIATMILVWAIVSGIQSGYCALAIGGMAGMVLAMSILSISQFSGASLNPFRTLGPAIFEKKFFRKGWWIYYTSEFLGGFIGAALALFGTHPSPNKC